MQINIQRTINLGQGLAVCWLSLFKREACQNGSGHMSACANDEACCTIRSEDHATWDPRSRRHTFLTKAMINVNSVPIFQRLFLLPVIYEIEFELFILFMTTALEQS